MRIFKFLISLVVNFFWCLVTYFYLIPEMWRQTKNDNKNN